MKLLKCLFRYRKHYSNSISLFYLKKYQVVLIYYSFSLIQTFFLLSIVLLVSLQNTSMQLSLQKLLSYKINPRHYSLSQKTRTVSFNQSSTTYDEEWSSKNIGSTLNINTQIFYLIGFLSCLSLLVYRTSWWFSGFEWFSIVLHHYLGLCFGFLVLFSLYVFHSVSWSFLYFFYLINLIRVDKLIWFP